MITKTKPILQQQEEHTKLLHLVLEEVRAMRSDLRRTHTADEWLANVPEVEDETEEGEAVIFNADRDNGGKGIPIRDFIKAIDVIDG